MNDFTAAVQALKARQSAGLGYALANDPRQPDAVADQGRTAEALGIPPSLVIADPEGLKRQAAMQRAAKLMAEMPATRAWLANEQNRALAKDDLETLRWFERAVNSTAAGRDVNAGVQRIRAIPSVTTALTNAATIADIGRSFDDIYKEELAKEGFDPAAPAVPMVGSSLSSEAPPDMLYYARQRAEWRVAQAAGLTEADRQRLIVEGSVALRRARELSDKAAALPMSASAEAFKSGALAQSDGTLMGMLGALAKDPFGGIAYTLDTAAQSLPQLAAATLVTAAARSPAAGAVALGTSSFLQENASSAMDFLQEKGVDVSTPDGALAALQNAKLMDEARQRGLTRGVIVGIMDGLSGGIAGKALAKSKIGDILLQGLAQVGFGAGGEGLAQLASGQKVNWNDIVMEGLAEMATAPVEVLGVGGRRLLGGVGRAARAGEAAAAVEAIDARAAASKLRERAPDAFKDAMDAQGWGDKALFVPADALREYFQTRDVPFDEAAMKRLGLDPQTFAEAESAGHDVAIPMSNYAAYVAGTGDAAWFKANGSFDPEEMSAEAAKSFNARVRDVMDEAMAEMQAAEESAARSRASDVQVHDAIYSQLRAAGQSPDVATNQAALWAGFFRSQAARTGEDPLDLFRAMPVEIRGVMSEDVQRRRDRLDMELNTLRANLGKKPKAEGASLSEFIMQRGGISDAGGEIAAMNPPKGIVSETAADVRARQSQATMPGMTAAPGKGEALEDAARAAAEAGYFPDIMGEVNGQSRGLSDDVVRRFVEALRADLAGQKVYREREGVDTSLDALKAELDRANVDLGSMSNDEAMAALNSANSGYAFFQPSVARAVEVAKAGLRALWNGTGTKVSVGSVSSWLRREARRSGLDISGFTHVVDRSAIDYIRKQHASGEAARGQVDLTEADVAAIPEILVAPDKVVFGLKGARGKDVIAYVKTMADGTTFYLEEARTGRHDLAAVSMRKYPAAIKSNDQIMARLDLNARSDGGDGVKIVDVPKNATATDLSSGGGQALSQADGAYRGAIVLPQEGVRDGVTLINLFQSSNLSTFLHESGHFFLEAFKALASDKNATDGMKADMDAVRRFVGNDGGDFTAEQHETWARGLEAYLMEGKAPSLELADAFARFKAWLVRIYRSALGLNVRLTQEIREVMDRMIATDAEIADARRAQEMRPLFAEAPFGMSPADFATYQRMARRGADQAERTLLERTMAKVRREKQAWFREERKAVRAEVQAEMDRQPVYRLVDALANGKWPDGEERPAVRISRRDLTEEFGDGVLPGLARTRLGGKSAIYGDDGLPPYAVAELFGFRDAATMIESLQNLRRKPEAVAAETDRRMTERHGDPLNDGTIEAEALAAIHSEQQVKTQVAEARHMATRIGRQTGDMRAKLYRQRARLMLGRMTVGDAVRSGVFLAAERRAARAAEKAFAKVARGGSRPEAALAEALQAKEQQILNGLLYNESLAFAKEVRAGRERMRRYSKASVRARLEGGYIEQIDAILEDYEFRQRAPGQIRRAENLKAFVDRMTAEGRANELAIDDRLLDDARRKHFTKLSADELRGLFDTVENLDHMGRFKQSLIDKAGRRDLDRTVAGVIGAIDANIKGNPPSRVVTKGERMRRAGRDYLNLTLNADTLLREIDGFKDFGPAWVAVKQDINLGMDRLTKRRFEAAKALDAIYSVYSGREKRDMAVKRHRPALGDSLSKWDLIGVALNIGNETNFQRLTNQKTKGSYTANQVRTALKELDGRDWTVVQSIWDYVNGFWGEIAEKERRMTGVTPKKVDARIMVDVPAGVRGGYYPIRYDARLATRVSELDTKDLMDRMRSGGFGKAQTRNEHTKERLNSVNLPLRLDLGVLHEHVNGVLYDLEIGEPVNNAWRVLNDERVKAAMLEKGMASDREALGLWLQDTAAGDQVQAGYGIAMLRRLRTGLVVSRLALTLSTALIQPIGITQSAVVVGKKAMLKGMMSYVSRLPRWVSEVTAVSPFMEERQKTFQRDLFNVVGDIQTGPVTGRWEKFQRDVMIPLSFLLMQKVQFYIVDMPTWVAAYQKEVGRSKDEAKARIYADAMVRRAQGSGLMSDRGMLERGTMGRNIRQSEIPRLFTALGSYMFAKFNVAYERTRATDFRNPVQVMSLAVDFALIFTLEQVAYSVVKGFLPGEDDNEGEWLLKQTALSMVGTLPFVRDAASATQGYDAGIYASVMATVVARPLQQAGQGDADRAAVRAYLDAAGVFLSLPSVQAKNLINAFFDEDMSLRRDPSLAQALGMGGEGRVTLMDWIGQN